MKHIRMFENAQQAADILPTLEYNTLSAIRGESGIVLKQGVVPGPEATPFYIDVRGPVTLAATSGLQMSADGENWIDTVAGDLPIGKTYFRVATDQSIPLKPDWTEKTDSDYDIGGNINSLVKTSFKNDTTCYSFYISNTGLFRGKAKLKSAGDLILPATTLADYCYNSMFSGCKALTTAPELPATTLAQNCYQKMFLNCISLTTAPALPATTLASYCYECMFDYCSLLTAAPELPATTLANYCYQYMFDYCTSLTTAPELPATTLAQSCYSKMFRKCTSLTTAPELPATTLASSCYGNMFESCTSLNRIECLATDISASGCTANWVNGVSMIGTFVKNPDMPTTSWPTGTSGIPSGWTVQDAA